MSQTYNLGKVAITPRGAYSSTAQYTPLDILSYNGSSYLVLQNCTGVTPPNATYYMVVASKGDTGTAGASPTISAGTVTMTPAGTSASVTNAGTNVNASFNFTLPNGNVIYTGTGVTGTSTEPTVFSGSGVSNAGVGDIYFNTSTVAFYSCAYGGAASVATWTFLTYAVPDGTVTTSKIADAAITRNKIDDGAVGNDELSDGSVSVSKLGSDVFGVLDAKANVDGAYEQMTVGNAEQLVSTVGIEDKSPYNFRTSGGSVDIGDRETDMIVGGTIAWNQMVTNGNFASTSGWTVSSSSYMSMTAANNKCTLACTSVSNRAWYIQQTVNLVADHVYLANGYIQRKLASIATGYAYSGYRMYVGSYYKECSLQSVDDINHFKFICKPDDVSSGTVRVYKHTCKPSETGDVFVTWDVYVSDLTQMFGSVIANYVLSLENSVEGSGVAWLNQYGFFDKEYYNASSVSLQSVNVSEHNMVGFNAYNPSSGSAKLVGGMEYQITGAYTAVSYMDIGGGNETLSIDQDGYFTPEKSGILTVTGGDSTTTCVHLVWDGEKDGDFEEYDVNSYALDSSLTLKGAPTLDDNNNLVYIGDTYESDGTVYRRAVTITLNGSESWGESATNTATYGRYFFLSLGAYGSVVNSIGACDKYPVVYPFTGVSTVGIDVFNSPARNKAIVTIRPSDSTISIADLQTLLASNPVTLTYIKTTPTEESADPYANPQIVSDWGTEEYVDYAYSQGTRDVMIPVGHETIYAANLRAKLEMMPDSPSNGNGDYVVRQTDGINSYVPLVIPQELPNAPAEEGTYYLKVTVDGEGNATYSWQSNA